MPLPLLSLSSLLLRVQVSLQEFSVDGGRTWRSLVGPTDLPIVPGGHPAGLPEVGQPSRGMRVGMAPVGGGGFLMVGGAPMPMLPFMHPGALSMWY